TLEEQDINMATLNPNTQTLEEQDTNTVTLDLFIQIDRGLNRIENHIRGVGTPLNNPINIINGIRGSLNVVRLNYQTAYQDINGVIAERDARDNQIVRLQQD
ncbi:7288_t:CDS:1, partial [Dentiscutata erythropus]